MRVVILHQAIPPTASADERDVLDQATAVAKALEGLGHQAIICPTETTPEDLRRTVASLTPEVIVNLVESFLGSDHYQYLAARVLEDLQIPFTGNGSRALFLTGDKRLTKALLREAGLPTPASPGCCEVCPGSESDEETARLLHLFREEGQASVEKLRGRRFLLKSAWAHASAGLEERLWEFSGEDDESKLERLRRELAEKARQTGEPWFAEEFIEGREFNLSLIAGDQGPIVFPPAEIDFSAFSPDQLRIVGYRAKWDATSFEYHATPRRFEFPPEEMPLLETLKRLAERCWTLFGLRGYARVDFRVDSRGQPYILEINANPCLSPDAGFVAAAAQAGYAFPQVVAYLLRDAILTRS